jgi:hypothetical protein
VTRIARAERLSAFSALIGEGNWTVSVHATNANFAELSFADSRPAIDEQT